MLDQYHILMLLKDYDIGPYLLHILSNFWDQHTVILIASWSLTHHSWHHSLATGDIPALALYNIVTNAILHCWFLDINNTRDPYQGTIQCR